MFMFAKIMQIERKILSLLEYFAVIQPILKKICFWGYAY